jgi:hypothetical protein
MSGIRTHTTLVVVGTYCIGSCKSNYHTARKALCDQCDIYFCTGFLRVLWFSPPIKLTATI